MRIVLSSIRKRIDTPQHRAYVRSRQHLLALPSILQ